MRYLTQMGVNEYKKREATSKKGQKLIDQEDVELPRSDDTVPSSRWEGVACCSSNKSICVKSIFYRVVNVVLIPAVGSELWSK